MKFTGEIVEKILLFAAIVLIFMLFKSALQYQKFTDHNTDTMIDRIVEGGTRDVATERFQDKVHRARKIELMDAVISTCLGRYQRDLCVVNLINCGWSCKIMIPKEQFPKIEADYWAMIDERHLRDKVKIPR